MTGHSDAVDLFGNPVDAPSVSAPRRPEVNDMDLIEEVLATASRDGYALIGKNRHVYHRVTKTQVEPVLPLVAHAVYQLIDAGWPTVGGNHEYTRGHRSATGRAVLVPRETRTKANRWRNLARPSTWPPKPGTQPTPARGQTA